MAAASQYRGDGGSEGQEEFGGADVHDVLNLVTVLTSLPDVDPDRIGMMGGSRGGMMTFLALKQDTAHTIKAAVTVGGISDLFAWADQRPDVVSSVYVPLIGISPDQDRQPYEDRSAIYWPELIDAPILLLHGEADREVSIQQTRALAEKLEAAGKTVDVITFPNGDHALSQDHGGVPEALDWFGRYLGGDNVDRSWAAHEQAISDTGTWFLARDQANSVR